MRLCANGFGCMEGASMAEKFGDTEVVAILDDVGGAANAGSVVGDVAVDGGKFGDAYDVVGVRFGETYAAVDSKLGDAFDVVGAKFGDVEAVAGVGGKSGDIDVFVRVGRRRGEVANESDRFDGSAVANSARKSGDVEPVIPVGGSCANVLGHTVSAPSSTWS